MFDKLLLCGSCVAILCKLFILFITLNKVALAIETADEILKWDHSNESY